MDDLLKTSWEACQGTDVLVESPSAMGGYHIAEALAIPYFRAFTMTWTRTRYESFLRARSCAFVVLTKCCVFIVLIPMRLPFPSGRYVVYRSLGI